jgi:hypothetical protein
MNELRNSLISMAMTWSVLQHEYGIFGGIAGSHILALLRKLKMPLVTTLHTVLREPDQNQRAVLEEIAQLSDRLIVMSEAAFPASLRLTSPRAWAFSVLGMQAYLDWFPGDRVIQGVRNALANRLLDIYEGSHSETWQWFEKSLSYSNARLSQALLTAGWQSDNKRMVEVGCESLRWLVAEQHRGDADIFVPIGSRECFAEGGEKARFDQQPVEACATISACLLAYRMTSEKRWLDEAWCAFRWFLGENDLQVPLYDVTTGGCRDGLHPDRVNENQGAESTLSFLMALIEMQSVEMASLEKLNQEMSVST